jgi:glycosyltransferase involved in cell wall biosynthesis
MNYETRAWGLTEYLATKLLHDAFAHVQQSIAVRRFSLVLLKGKQLAADYGRGRANVRYFLDSAFTYHQMIPRSVLKDKIASIDRGYVPLRVVYFGRLVVYKGVDHMLRAVAHAVSLGARLRFDVIGAGPEEKALEELSCELGIADRVAFHGAIPYGPGLFERLYPAHVLLAAPLSQDTPRNALDACAAGLAILAYDTYYYRELADLGAPVTLLPWLDWKAMGTRLAELSVAREPLADMARRAERFARENTQEIWLERRVGWTRQLASAPSVAFQRTSEQSATAQFQHLSVHHG